MAVPDWLAATGNFLGGLVGMTPAPTEPARAPQSQPATAPAAGPGKVSGAVGGLPSWVIPAGIAGVAALVLVMFLRKG